MKLLTLVIVGVDCQLLDIQISEAETAGEILSALDMEDYVLVSGHETTRTFYNKETV